MAKWIRRRFQTAKHNTNINMLGDIYPTLRLSNSDTRALDAGVYVDAKKSIEATYFLDVVRACFKQVDDFDLVRGDVSSGRWSSNVADRRLCLTVAKRALLRVMKHQTGRSRRTTWPQPSKCKKELLKCKQSSPCPRRSLPVWIPQETCGGWQEAADTVTSAAAGVPFRSGVRRYGRFNTV